MLDCLTYIAFVYWAVSTVHTILPINVAMCKTSGSGLSGGFLHAFGGEVNLDVHEWEGYPCNTNLLFKFFFILRRPGPAVRHIMHGGGQDEPFVPILFLVPLIFSTVTFLQHLLRVRIVSPTVLRTFLKFGVAIGCRGVILLQSIRHPNKHSLYYKRYSKVEFFIIAWTAYIIELPVCHEALVSGGTLATILLMCCLFPHHMLPEVDPRVVALQAIAGTVFGVVYASRQQRRRRHDQQRAAGQWGAPSMRPMGKKTCSDTIAEDESYYGGEKLAGGSRTEADASAPYMPPTTAAAFDAVQALRGSPPSPSRCTPNQPGRSGDSNIITNITDAAATATTTTTTTNITDATAASTTTTNAATATGTPTATATTPATTRGVPDCTTPATLSSTAVAHYHDHVLRLTHYVSRARPYRFSVKIQHAHLADLPPNLMNVVNERVLRASGMQAVRVYAREGCVELVLDLRPINPVRRHRTDPDAALLAAAMAAAAVGDDSRPEIDQDPQSNCTSTEVPISDVDEAAPMPLDATTLSQLGAAIVSCLHSSGVVQPTREPYVVLQIGDEAVYVSWQPESQTWVVMAAPPPGTTGDAATASDNDSDDAGANSAVPPVAVVPMLTAVRPSVVTWPGPDVSLRLTVALRGPSAEEIMAGGGLVVRGREGTLPYSIVQVTRELGDAAEVEAPAAELMRVVVDVSAVPSSGLLQVEARSRTGLLSTARALVVDPDEQLISGLKSLVSYMDDESADAVLLDYGTWLDIAASAGLSQDGKAVGCSGWCIGGGRDSDTAAAITATAIATPPATIASTTTNEINPAADRPCMPSLDLIPQLRDQLFEGACSVRCGGGGGGGSNLMYRTNCPPLPRESMLAAAADLLFACCQAGGDGPALAAVADRLIAIVIACDGRPYGIALTALLTAVRSPPTNASALHLAIASGSPHVAEILLRWHTRFVLEASASAVATAAAADASLWLDRAAGGVTPLHVAAAATDGGILATWALTHYPAVAAAWRSVQTDDGMTPAALAARQGGRWRLRLWYGNPIILWIRRVVAVQRTATLGRGWELLWGFRDGLLEQRFLTTLNSQATLSLTVYATLNALLPLACITKAALYGGPEILLAALAFHGPSTAPLLAWLCKGARYHQHHPTKTLTTDPTTTTTTNNNNSATAFQCCDPTFSEQALDYTARNGLRNGWLGTDRYDPSGVGGCANHHRHRGGGLTVSGLQWVVLVMQLCRAVAKAAVGLSVGRFTWPRSAAAFVSCGGDILVEALVRPFFEQMSLPARLLVSLADGPAMYVLYRGMELRYPGSVHRPLARALLYQVVLLAATAAISAANRARFLRWRSERNAKMGSNLCHRGGNTPATIPATAIATAANVTGIATSNGTTNGTTATGGMHPVGPHRRQRC